MEIRPRRSKACLSERMRDGGMRTCILAMCALLCPCWLVEIRASQETRASSLALDEIAISRQRLPRSPSLSLDASAAP